MKVLHVYKCFYPETTGGVELVIHQLCQTLPKHGIQSDVAVASKPTAHVFKSDYPVFRFRTTLSLSSCPMSVDFFNQFDALTSRYDLIHYHFPWPFADAMHLATHNKKPYVITYHTDIVKQRFLKPLYEPLMHRFFKQARSIAVTSPSFMQPGQTPHAYADKVNMIPLGISSAQYPVTNVTLLREWNAKLGSGFFLFIGVLRYYKGVEFLLQAAKQTDAHIVIAGAGPEEATLKQLAATLKLNNVTFLGYVSEQDKAALLSLCRAVVAPAHLRSEAFCLSILEGFLYNKPAISTEIGTGTSYVNQHGKTGIVVPPADPRALAEAMDQLQDDPVFYEQLQSNIPAHYASDFTAEKMTERYVALYRAC